MTKDFDYSEFDRDVDQKAQALALLSIIETAQSNGLDFLDELKPDGVNLVTDFDTSTEERDRKQILYHFAENINLSMFFAYCGDEETSAERLKDALVAFWLSPDTTLKEKRQTVELADELLGFGAVYSVLVDLGVVDISDIDDEDSFAGVIRHLEAQRDNEAELHFQNGPILDKLKETAKEIAENIFHGLGNKFIESPAYIIAETAKLKAQVNILTAASQTDPNPDIQKRIAKLSEEIRTTQDMFCVLFRVEKGTPDYHRYLRAASLLSIALIERGYRYE